MLDVIKARRAREDASLTEEEQRLVFERKLEIFQRIAQWRAENQELGLSSDISDNWTPALNGRDGGSCKIVLIFRAK